MERRRYSEGEIYNFTFWGGIIWMFVIASFLYLGGFFITMLASGNSLSKDITVMIQEGVTSKRLMSSLFLIELNSKLIPIAFLVYAFKNALIRDMKDFKNNIGRYIAVIIISIFVFMVSTNIVAAIYEHLGIKGQSENQNLIEQALNSPIRPLGFITVVILAPIIEELIFRKALFGLIEKKFNWSKTVAVIISTLVFSAIHVISGNSLIFIFQYIPLALIISYSYAHTENIYIPILLHFLNNLLSFLFVIGIINV